MKKIILIYWFLVITVLICFAQDSFSGKYIMENQADYDTKKKWFEITRNRYQELVVNSEKIDNCIAYYDEKNSELFFVIEKPAQYNTLMKIKLTSLNKIDVFMLVNNKWTKSSESYVLE